MSFDWTQIFTFRRWCHWCLHAKHSVFSVVLSLFFPFNQFEFSFKLIEQECFCFSPWCLQFTAILSIKLCNQFKITNSSNCLIKLRCNHNNIFHDTFSVCECVFHFDEFSLFFHLKNSLQNSKFWVCCFFHRAIRIRHIFLYTQSMTYQTK